MTKRLKDPIRAGGEGIKTWDVAIIGSGPAGLTAAIYATRGAASTIVLAGEAWGGQLMLTTIVDNYPALPGISGPELMQKMRDHALKFGAEFRVYNKGVKPGEDHARWVVFPVHEGSTLTWYEFAAKNRVAHSTRKRLMIGIVDEEGDVTYYEIAWKRP